MITAWYLPVKYLGLPLLSKRFSATACTPLIQGVIACLHSWKAKLLPYVGRVELIKSVLSSMQLYWTSVFILPVSVLQILDRVMFRFLWFSHGAKKNIYVSWYDVCRPKDEGGLGIRRPRDSNQAGVLQLLWELETNLDALWVQWTLRSTSKVAQFGALDLCKMHPGHGMLSSESVISPPHF